MPTLELIPKKAVFNFEAGDRHAVIKYMGEEKKTMS